MKLNSPESYEPWWEKENRSELEDILFRAAKDFIASIDPVIVVERTDRGIKFNYIKEGGSIDTWRSFELVITALLFKGNSKEEFENYARTGFRDYIRDSIIRTPYKNKQFVESLGFEVPKHVFEKNPKKKPN
ncbi:hypothetical protein C4587_00690 [Candidatus Parcubacteria bacterium]|nr:MAG: hypothetical protein C4587_00690 [Candidatus Parcubacteria bacterium]